MVCPHCQQQTQVINSRHQKRLNQVWRRRKCVSCSTVFSTHEKADYGALWRVSSNKRPMSPFNRDKLFLSLLESCKHRSTALADAASLADTVISQLAPHVTNGALTAKEIIISSQVALNRFDKAASTHYQAFHPDK